MIKRILVVLGYSIFWTAVIFALLAITNRHVMQPLVSFIRKIRGTDGYEGEERGHEGMMIVANIFLAVFVIILGTVAVVVRKKRRGR